MTDTASAKHQPSEHSRNAGALAAATPDATGPSRCAAAILAGLKDAIARELHDYPYPIAGCDEVFKTLSHQRECCRIALAGLGHSDGLTPEDAAEAIRDLLATPVQLSEHDRATLAGHARAGG